MKTNLFHRSLPGRRFLRRVSVVALASVAWGFGVARLSGGDVRNSGNSTAVIQYEQGRRAEHGIGGRANPHSSARANQHTLTARLTGTQLAEAPSRASSLLPTMAGPTGR